MRNRPRMQDPVAYGGRVARRQIDQAHNPSPATNTRDLHGDEGKTRTEFHPLDGNSRGRKVGRYLGSVGDVGGPRTHFFSAESTQGDQTDSFQIHDTGRYMWHPTHDVRGEGRYVFDTAAPSSGNIQAYNGGVHYGIPGAPMSDTPAKYHDRNYR